jgi:hypothetical protein
MEAMLTTLPMPASLTISSSPPSAVSARSTNKVGRTFVREIEPRSRPARPDWNAVLAESQPEPFRAL